MAREFIARGFSMEAVCSALKHWCLEELKLYAPEVYETSKLAWENNQAGNLDLDLSMAIPSISIDYAVMERSKKNKSGVVSI
jgi:mannose-1-phosphate guanylyltransferase